jgi:hypothetical protein
MGEQEGARSRMRTGQLYASQAKISHLNRSNRKAHVDAGSSSQPPERLVEPQNDVATAVFGRLYRVQDDAAATIGRTTAVSTGRPDRERSELAEL